MRLTTKYIQLLKELLALPKRSMRMTIFGRKAYRELENDQLFCTVRDAVLMDADVSWHHDYYRTLRSRFGRFTKQEKVVFNIAFGLHCGNEAFDWFQKHIKVMSWAEERLARARANYEKTIKNSFRQGKVVRDKKTGRFVSNMQNYNKMKAEEKKKVFEENMEKFRERLGIKVEGGEASDSKGTAL